MAVRFCEIRRAEKEFSVLFKKKSPSDAGWLRWWWFDKTFSFATQKKPWEESERRRSLMFV